MPNWCSNYVSFVCDDNLREFLADIEVPTDACEVTKIISVGKLLEAKGVPEALYAHISGRYLVLPVEILCPGNSADCSMKFETAWDYPTETMTLLVQAYGLSGTALAEEASNGVFYKYVYKDGDEVESTNYLPIIEKRARKYILRYLKDMRKGTSTLSDRKHASILSAFLARVIKKYRKNPETMSHWDIEEGAILDNLVPTRKIVAFPSGVIASLDQLEISITDRHRLNNIVPDFVDWETFT